jgi:hypothetical protein
LQELRLFFEFDVQESLKMKFVVWFLRKTWLVMSLSSLSMGSMAQLNLRLELARPLQQAQEALKLNQASEALLSLQEARKVAALKDEERLLIERLTAVAAMSAQQYALAIPALAYLIQSPAVNDAEKLILLEHAINANQRLKNYPAVVKLAQQYVAADGTNPAIRLMLLQTLSVQGQHEAVVSSAREILDKETVGGVLASESELRVLAASQSKLKDQSGYFKTLKLLVARAPSKDYWVDLVSRIQSQSGFSQRFELDVYRLLEAVGGLDEADDLSYMANLALKAGLPSEAVRLVEQGYTAKVLGTGAEAANHAKLKQQAMLRLAEDEKTLGVLEKSAKEGNDWGQMGDLLASHGMWGRANEAYAKALEVGQLRREAELRLHYGLSLFKAKQLESARTLWLSVKGDVTAVELAALWRLWVK